MENAIKTLPKLFKRRDDESRGRRANRATEIRSIDFEVHRKTEKTVYVIKCKDKEIITKNLVLCGLGNDDCPFFFSPY